MPDVTLVGEGGARVRLRDLVKERGLVVYFYPKDDTPGCTAESCSFRDQYEDFVQAGADVVGISADPPDSHSRFASKYRLPFTLLSDGSGEARAAFGVKPALLGLMPGRVTFVFDGQGGAILEERNGCLEYHGASCGFSGTLTHDAAGI